MTSCLELYRIVSILGLCWNGSPSPTVPSPTLFSLCLSPSVHRSSRCRTHNRANPSLRRCPSRCPWTRTQQNITCHQPHLLRRPSCSPMPPLRSRLLLKKMPAVMRPILPTLLLDVLRARRSGRALPRRPRSLMSCPPSPVPCPPTTHSLCPKLHQLTCLPT